MVTLTFYGGINEIGGNKVLLEDNGTRIFLDFGMSFGPPAPIEIPILLTGIAVGIVFMILIVIERRTGTQ